MSTNSSVGYNEEYARSVAETEKYWQEAGKRIDWIRPYSKADGSSYAGNVQIKWYEDGTLNVANNCVDRHARVRPDAPAIIWVADSEGESLVISYEDLRKNVNRFANVLRMQGVKKGDRVTLYMPMIPKAAYAMLACARIGAVHSVVFAGFSAESLANRIVDAESHFIITADEGRRGGKRIPLKETVDEALRIARMDAKVLVVKHTGGDVSFSERRDVWLHDVWGTVGTECESEEMSAEDPFFILYTSGSTGKPKGLVHTTGGYLVYASMTHERIFAYQPGEVYWCTADIGWITGHSYLVYGPLANGATTLMFEGVPNQPTPKRIWDIVDEWNVSVLYTAPTLIRSLMAAGDRWLEGTSRKSLRMLGTVGEPINPEAWRWYYEKVGDSRCPIADTWWQTETGGVLITPLPDTAPLKPGAAMKPFFGIIPDIVDENGESVPQGTQGRLLIRRSWPGQARTIHGDHARFMETYFSAVPGAYLTGDGAHRDVDGDYWIIGRVDDVVNVSGHRFGTAEIESALVAHPAVAEAAVIGVPHPIKGQSLFCFVILRDGYQDDEGLIAQLKQQVRADIGAIAVPDDVVCVPGLPKTRSGKIMRRILRKLVAREDDLGDVSTLVDPRIIEEIKTALSLNRQV